MVVILSKANLKARVLQNKIIGEYMKYIVYLNVINRVKKNYFLICNIYEFLF